MALELHPGPVTSGDFGAADGEPAAVDLVVGDAFAPRLAVLRGDGSGSFTTAVVRTVDGAIGGFADLVAADVNRDDHLDVIASLPEANAVVAALGNGALGFTEVVWTQASPVPGRLIVEDVDGDRIADLLVATGSGVTVLKGSGDGSFGPLNVLPFGSPGTDMILRDFSDDAVADLLAAVPAQDIVRVHRGFGNGQFQRVGGLRGNNPIYIGSADFTGDARLDVVLLNVDDDTLSVFAGLPGAIDTVPVIISGVNAGRIEVADFNADALGDVVALDDESGEVGVLLGDPVRRLQLVNIVETGEPTSGLAVADLDGDGRTDIIVSAAAGMKLFIGINRTTPVSPASPSPAPSSTPSTTPSPPPADTETPTPVATAAATQTAVATETAEPSATPEDTRTLTPAPSPTASPFPSDTPTPLPTDTPPPTATARASATPLPCAGDCDASRTVTVDELVRGVAIALGSAPLTTCPEIDTNRDERVEIDELVRALRAAGDGC